MAKSKRKAAVNPKTVNLILLIASLVTAGLSLIGLLCPFITQKSEVLGYVAKENWNMGAWFEQINDMDGYDNIGNWQFARVALVVGALLLIAMVALLVLRLFIKHTSLKWATIGVGMAMVACAVVFMVVTIAGCNVMGNEIVGIKTGVTYTPHAGVFLFSIFAVISAILTEVTVTRK